MGKRSSRPPTLTRQKKCSQHPQPPVRIISVPVWEPVFKPVSKPVRSLGYLKYRVGITKPIKKTSRFSSNSQQPSNRHRRGVDHMFWHAMPPELNTARLMAGAGQAPMLAAALGWEALSAALDGQAAELTARLNSLGEAWTGGSSDKAIGSALPLVTWLQTASTQAKTRGLQATAQAAAYTQAMATTPSLPEIAMNHVTTAVLTATNFFGINTIPIALTEIDYFVRMWTQAAVAMDVYEAETLVNTMFEKIEPMTAILDPGMSQSMTSSPLMGMPAKLGGVTPGQLQATVGQVARLSGPMQQVAQPAQQMTSMFSQMGS